MKKLLLLLLGWLLVYCATAQNNAIYNQFNFNPYIYNPAFVGYSNATEINTAFRRQWAEVEDSPLSAVLSIEHPFNDRVSIGLQLNHDQAVLLQRNSILLTYGYKINFGRSQFLSFGISGGVGRYGLDNEGIDLSDPTISNAVSSSYYADGNVGILYSNPAFDVSIGLNNIFETNPYSGENFESIKLSGLDNIFASFRYRVYFSNPKLQLLPYVFYQHLGTEFNQLEAGALFAIQDKLFLGGSYRYRGMPSAIVGFNLLKNVSASYSYEFGPSELNSFQGGSHELMVKFRFKRKKSRQKDVISELIEKNADKEANYIVGPPLSQANDSKNSRNQKELVSTDPEKNSSEPPVSTIDKPEVTIADSAALSQEKKQLESSKQETTRSYSEPLKLQANQGVLKQGYYVIFGVFQFEENARSFIETASDNGFNFYYAQNPNNKYFYIFKSRFQNELEAKNQKSKFDKISNYNDSWIYYVD